MDTPLEFTATGFGDEDDCELWEYNCETGATVGQGPLESWSGPDMLGHWWYIDGELQDTSGSSEPGTYEISCCIMGCD